MRKRVKLIYNIYFHLPFLLWLLLGGGLLHCFSRVQLFSAINGKYNSFTDAGMPVITSLGQPEVIIPALLLLMIIPALRTWRYFLSAAACNLVPLALQQWLKRVYHYPRPLNYFHWHDQKAAWLHYLPQWPDLLRNSFPSGHSQGAFSFFCFTAMLLSVKYKWIGFIFFCAAFLVAYSRIYLAAHFFADVYVGSIIGCVLTTLIFSLANTWFPIYPERNMVPVNNKTNKSII